MQVVGQVFDRFEHPLLLCFGLAGRRWIAAVARYYGIERPLVNGLNLLLDYRILNHDKAPILHVTAARRTQPSIDDPANQNVGHGIGFESPHRPHVIDRF